MVVSFLPETRLIIPVAELDEVNVLFEMKALQGQMATAIADYTVRATVHEREA